MAKMKSIKTSDTVTQWKIWDEVNCQLVIFVAISKQFTIRIYRFVSPIIQSNPESAKLNLRQDGKPIEYGKEFARFVGIAYRPNN